MSAAELSPWLRQPLVELLRQRGHAWLLQGPSGLGQYDLALALASAWLCEQPTEEGAACGHCPSCHAIEVRTHADLCVLMPEVAMLDLGWPLDEKAQADIDDKKRKASREIRVEAMRDAVGFAQRTSARGRGKVVLVYPAERMNTITANALLKTLEEPVGDVRFVLASEAAWQLLPTIRSRCLSHNMLWPVEAQSRQWLQEQGVDADTAAVLLRAAGGRPADVLAWTEDQVSARQWRQLPRALAQGDVQALAGRSPAQMLDVLIKLCHDWMALSSGAAPRFFDEADLPAAPALPALVTWSAELRKLLRHAEHPYNAGLLQETLVAQVHALCRQAGRSSPTRAKAA